MTRIVPLALGFLAVSTVALGQCVEMVAGPQATTLLGNVLLDDVQPEGAHWIVATDNQGACVGQTMLVSNEGTSFFNLAIYGDDPTTGTQDEGLVPGEAFQLSLWTEEWDLIQTLSGAGAWQNTNGAPLGTWNDPWQSVHFYSTPICPGDANFSGTVEVNDLLGFLGVFGHPCLGCIQDMDQNGTIQIADLLHLLIAFGNSC